MGYVTRLTILGSLDAVLIALAVMLAYLLRFDFNIPSSHFAILPNVIILNIALGLIGLTRIKMYRRVWQYASIGELVALFKVATVTQLLLLACNALIHMGFSNYVVPRSIFLLAWAFIILGVGGSRFAWRLFRDSYTKLPMRINNRRTLIIGAGQAGVLIVKEIKQSQSDLYPVAFIDDDKTKWSLEMMGIPILGGREHIEEVVKEYNIQKIIIAIPSATRAQIADILAICKHTKAKIKIIPRMSDLISSKISINMIREVRVEDLLGRDPVEVDLEGIANYVTDQVVLVTGAGGSIGSELSRQISGFKPKQLLLLGHGENSIYNIELELRKKYPDLALETIIADIQDLSRLREIFANFKPAVVFHAAAHKHVPLMERNPAEAVKNNIFGTKNVAECAHEFGAARFVMISTDKAVNPTSIMGTTKRVAEMIIQSLDRISETKFVAVRFGNVLGSRGSVIPVFERQIREGGPVTVTHPDMVRYFMTIPEAVQLVIQAGAFANGGEVFILDMGQPVRIVDLARDLIRLSGYEPNVDIEIAYMGIRPGEKLYEEILTNEEGIAATRHNRIFVGKPTNFSSEEFNQMLTSLRAVVVQEKSLKEVVEVKRLLKTIVPTFQEGSRKTRPEDVPAKLKQASGDGVFRSFEVAATKIS